jgi:hypothetical protein
MKHQYYLVEGKQIIHSFSIRHVFPCVDISDETRGPHWRPLKLPSNSSEPYAKRCAESEVCQAFQELEQQFYNFIAVRSYNSMHKH